MFPLSRENSLAVNKRITSYYSFERDSLRIKTFSYAFLSPSLFSCSQGSHFYIRDHQIAKLNAAVFSRKLISLTFSLLVESVGRALDLLDDRLLLLGVHVLLRLHQDLDEGRAAHEVVHVRHGEIAAASGFPVCLFLFVRPEKRFFETI